jgi:hypothetical protein
MEIRRKALPPETARWLESIGRLSDEAFSFSQDLWVRIIYDLGVTYHQGSTHRARLSKSMIPLYLGREASFGKGNIESSASEVEEKIESLCKLFEGRNPYLRERWTKGKGGESHGRNLEGRYDRLIQQISGESYHFFTQFVSDDHDCHHWVSHCMGNKNIAFAFLKSI